MKNTVIFYGSTTGTCEDIAGRIAKALGIDSANVLSADKLTADAVASYDALILGSSTWGDGELQDDWYDAIEKLKGADLKGKTIALFGCGDSSSYSTTFCDAMGIIHSSLEASGAEFVGSAPASDYTFDSSVAVKDGNFVGLAIDDVNEADKTDSRIEKWAAEVKSAL